MLPMSPMEDISLQVGEPEFCHVVTRSTVNLGVTEKAPGSDKWEYVQASGFLISVEGTWFLITAGHVLTVVEEKIAAGWKFGRWHLDDSSKRGERPPPFTFTNEDTLVDVEERKNDYACIRIRPMHRAQLEANGKIAMAEDQWRPDWGPPNPPDIKAVCIVGVPAEQVQIVETPDVNVVNKAIAFLEVIPMDVPDAPEELRWKEVCFYGKIGDKLVDEETGIEVKSIQGMSGGPILALSITDGGSLSCVPLAVQSTWYPKSRIVVGCPLRAFAEDIREHFTAR